MSKNILVVRHMFSADLFTLEDILTAKGYRITKVQGYTHDLKTINPTDYDAVIVLGGAPGVYQADIFPFLHDEIALIRKCIDADHPMLGICLGAQLTAAATGQAVYKGANGKEIGFRPIALTPAGEASPLRHFAPEKTRIFQWHGDTFDLPPEAVLLASSDIYKNQAFRIGKHIFATQFHPEVSHAGLWNTMVECCNDIDIAAMAAEEKEYLPTMMKQMHAFTDELLSVWGLEK